jgi:hypothetical protein
MKLRNRIIIALVLIFLLIITFYAIENIFLKQGEKHATVIKVKTDDETVALLSSGVFEELKKQEINNKKAGFSKDFGPSLSFVISSVGINDFESIIIKGIDKSMVNLSKTEVNDDMVFMVYKNKTVDLYSQSHQKLIIKTVSEIDVRR